MKWIKYLSILAAFGCGVDRPDVPKSESIAIEWEGDYRGSERFFLVEIDGCEYMISDSDRSRNIMHKGDCKNSIHCYNTPK